VDAVVGVGTGIISEAISYAEVSMHAVDCSEPSRTEQYVEAIVPADAWSLRFDIWYGGTHRIF